MENPIEIYAFGSLLIETSQDEDQGEFRAYVMELLADTYGKIPDWLRFSAGRRFEWNGTFYREFSCAAGSVESRIQLRAEKTVGISRSIILRGMRLGAPYCCEIHAGIKTQIDCEELRTAD